MKMWVYMRKLGLSENIIQALRRRVQPRGFTVRSQGDWGQCLQQAEQVDIHVHCLPVLSGNLDALIL